MPGGRAEPIIDRMSFLAASTGWPDAAVAIAGIALVGTVAVVIVWQALGTWRARMSVGREEAYRRLAEQTARDLHEIRDYLVERGDR
jgi:hypothetical protein